MRTCGWAAPLQGQAASSAPIRGLRAATARLEKATGPGIPALREDRCEGCLQAVLRGTLRRPAAAQVPQRGAWCRVRSNAVVRCFFFLKICTFFLKKSEEEIHSVRNQLVMQPYFRVSSGFCSAFLIVPIFNRKQV